MPSIPIHSFFKNHTFPKKEEGIDEIITIQFVPGPFENEEDEKAYY